MGQSMKTPQGRELATMAGRLPDLIDKLDAAIASTTATMKALEVAGLIYAAEHWRDGKYLYLIHPSKDGRRERKYVGADDNKVAEARAGILRGQEYDELATRLRKLEQAAQAAQSRLDGVLSALAAW